MSRIRTVATLAIAHSNAWSHGLVDTSDRLGLPVRMELGLRGKVAVVLGASKGMGRAAAKALADEGCSLAVAARDGKAVSEAFPDSLALACDVTQDGDRESFLKAALERSAQEAEHRQPQVRVPAALRGTAQAAGQHLEPRSPERGLEVSTWEGAKRPQGAPGEA